MVEAQDMGEEIQRIPKKTPTGSGWELRSEQNDLYKTPKGNPHVKTLLKPYTECEWNQRCQTKEWKEIKGDQQIILLSLRREDEILNLRIHDLDLTKGRLEAVRMEAKSLKCL